MVTIRAIYENGEIRLLDDVELEDGQQLEIVISEGREQPKKRTPNLHPGAFVVNDDFDDPLDNSFWLGEDQ